MYIRKDIHEHESWSVYSISLLFVPWLRFFTNMNCRKGFVILIILYCIIATADIVLWDDTIIVPYDSQLWAIQCTWNSYRNN